MPRGAVRRAEEMRARWHALARRVAASRKKMRRTCGRPSPPRGLTRPNRPPLASSVIFEAPGRAEGGQARGAWANSRARAAGAGAESTHLTPKHYTAPSSTLQSYWSPAVGMSGPETTTPPASGLGLHLRRLRRRRGPPTNITLSGLLPAICHGPPPSPSCRCCLPWRTPPPRCSARLLGRGERK